MSTDNPVSDDCKTAARALLPGRQVSDRGSDDSGEVVDLVHSESVSDNLYPSTPESVPDDQVPTSPETPPSRGNEAESRGRENAPPFPEYKGDQCIFSSEDCSRRKCLIPLSHYRRYRPH